MPERLYSEAPQHASVPYQAYKSKRHSRNISNPTHLLNGNGSGNATTAAPGPKPRPSSFMGTPSSFDQHDLSLGEKEDVTIIESEKLPTPDRINGIVNAQMELTQPVERTTTEAPVINGTSTMSISIPLEQKPAEQSQAAPPQESDTQEGSVASSNSGTPSPSPIVSPQPPLPPLPASTSTTPVSSPPSQQLALSNEASSSSSTTPAKSLPVQGRRTSTFRHVPLRPSRAPIPSSPLRPSGASSSASVRTISSPLVSSSRLPAEAGESRVASPTSASSTITPNDIPPAPTNGEPRNTRMAHATPTTSPPPIDSLRVQTQTGHIRSVSDATLPVAPPPRSSSLRPPSTTPPPTQMQSRASSSTPSSAPTSPRPGTSSSLPTRTPAPYRPGFQPKGVYRPRTEEFIEARRKAHDSGSLRIERTKLERRLEKLIALHFPVEGAEPDKSHPHRPLAGTNRRASSFFDLDLSDLKNIDPGGLWKSVMMQGGSNGGGKGDLRAAEQRITPWEDDSAVNKCPLCSASFHPLTNRKHHCRLCGKIICSLPSKHPQRPVTCSLLFVVDRKTRMIEEVSEGVDYGVRKKRASTLDPKGGKGSTQDDEEKFLKGVRICRTCRPVLTRQQYQQEAIHVPTFVRLYEVFVTLEKEIEASLPQFEELLLSLNHDDHPTKEAMAARKRLLEAFAQYDSLSKRIRQLPCPSGPGSSQDRVQLAVMTRANLFLQKHMFPLQTLPKKTKSQSSTPTPTTGNKSNGPTIDPDSELAHALQPLLEQEALLESFIEEANAHRKFEDVKTLQANLKEIRVEIDRMVANAGDKMR